MFELVVDETVTLIIFCGLFETVLFLGSSEVVEHEEDDDDDDDVVHEDDPDENKIGSS